MWGSPTPSTPNLKACEHRLYSHCTRVVIIPGNEHPLGVFTDPLVNRHLKTPMQRVLASADCKRAHECGALEALSYERLM